MRRSSRLTRRTPLTTAAAAASTTASAGCTWRIRSARRAAAQLPVYVKTAFGTATQGTFRVHSQQDLTEAVEVARPVLERGVLVQQPIDGRLGRVLAVFSSGRLVGFHACAQVEEGVSGGDLIKESIDVPVLRAHLERLGQHLRWHGGLSLDFISDLEGQPHYIDSNPRLAETGNALAAGVNLPELLVQVSLGAKPTGCLTGKPGVRTFMGIQGIAKAAKASGLRRDVLRAITDLVGHRGRFSTGAEELTPARQDLRSLIPFIIMGGALVARPRLWKAFTSTTVNAYSATAEVIRFVQRGRSSDQTAS